MKLYQIVGAYFRPPAALLLSHLRPGTALRLCPEPDNAHDPHAVGVYWRPASGLEALADHAGLSEALAGHGFTLSDVEEETEFHLGYLPSAKNKKIVAESRNNGDFEDFAWPDEGLEGELMFDPTGVALFALPSE